MPGEMQSCRATRIGRGSDKLFSLSFPTGRPSRKSSAVDWISQSENLVEKVVLKKLFFDYSTV